MVYYIWIKNKLRLKNNIVLDNIVDHANFVCSL